MESKPTVLENKVVGKKTDTFFEEEKTPTDYPTKDDKESIDLPFELLPRDVELIEQISERERISYPLALRVVLRQALDLYHKVLNIVKE